MNSNGNINGNHSLFTLHSLIIICIFFAFDHSPILPFAQLAECIALYSKWIFEPEFNDDSDAWTVNEISLFRRSSNYHWPTFVHILLYSIMCCYCCVENPIRICWLQSNGIINLWRVFAFRRKEFIGFVAKGRSNHRIHSLYWRKIYTFACLAWCTGHLCINSMNLFTSRTTNRDKCVSSEGNTSKTWPEILVPTTCCYRRTVAGDDVTISIRGRRKKSFCTMSLYFW